MPANLYIHLKSLQGRFSYKNRECLANESPLNQIFCIFVSSN